MSNWGRMNDVASAVPVILATAPLNLLESRDRPVRLHDGDLLTIFLRPANLVYGSEAFLGHEPSNQMNGPSPQPEEC